MPSTLNEFLEKALEETNPSIDEMSPGNQKHFAMVQDLIGNFNGAIGWLEDMKVMVKQGNWKTARQTYANLMKNLKKISKSIG